MIVTFYSFKGGVGRSMALANIGAWLYRQGRRVLMVDWDLEAPGLESFFAHNPAELEAIRATSGLVDLVETYHQLWDDFSPLEGKTAGNERTVELVTERIGPINHLFWPLAGTPKEAISRRDPGIWLFHAGCRTGASETFYRRSVNALDWGSFYDQSGGYYFVEWFRRELEKDVDFVLVDSRTGLTEMGGVCTQHLADVVILLFAPNDANLYGVQNIAKLLRADKVKGMRGPSRPLTLFPIPARVDTQGATAELEAFEKRFRSAFDGLSHKSLDWCWESRIRYVTGYSYQEEIIVLDDTGHADLKLAYARIGEQILLLREEKLSHSEREYQARTRSSGRQPGQEAQEPAQATIQQLISTARSKMDSGDFKTASSLLTSAVELAKQDLGNDHPDTLAAMNSLAASLYASGDLAGALKLQEEVLAGSRSRLGPDQPDTLTAEVNLAALLAAQGDLGAARRLHEDALAARRRVLGPAHPDTATSMSRLGEILLAQGDLTGARTLHERALEIRQRVCGETHPDTLASMSDLAQCLAAQGDFAGARGLEEKALEQRRQVLGGEHPDTLRSMDSLAQSLMGQGDFRGARRLQEQALAVRRRVLGEEHPDTIRSMNDLAHCVAAQGEFSAARVLQEQALVASRRILGEEHPDTCRAMANQARILQALGDVLAASQLHESVLDIRLRVLGEDHPDTLASLNDLAQAQLAKGEFAAAAELQHLALEARRRILGEEHPDTLTSMNDMAHCLMARGDLDRAQRLEEQALAGRYRTLGEEHPDTVRSMTALAGICRAKSNLAEARAWLERAAHIRHRLGDDHPDTLKVWFALGDVLFAEHAIRDSLDVFQRSVAIAAALLGRDPANWLWQFDLATCHLKLGDVRLALEDKEGALSEYREAVQLCETVASSHRADARLQVAAEQGHESIGDVLMAMGRPADAIDEFRRALVIQQSLVSQEPSADQWQTRLSELLEKIGKTLRVQGDEAGALAYYRKGFDTAQAAAARKASKSSGATPPPVRKIPEEFLVAFALAGEHRELVRPVAEALEAELGASSVFFDEWFEHYLAGPDADLKLVELLTNRSVLTVVCVSEHSGGKPWTAFEIRAIRARYTMVREPLATLPIRVGDGDLEGIVSNAIVPDVRSMSPREAARLIVNRLQLIMPVQSDWPEEAPRLVWRVADRAPVLQAFGRLLTREAEFRLLPLRGASEMGKSLILREMLRGVLGMQNVACGLFDFKGHDRDGELLSFTQHLGLSQPATGGRLNERFSHILDGLKQRARATILLFDTYESAGEAAEWVEKQLLPTLIRTRWLRVVIAGQRVPAPAGGLWESVSSPVLNLEAVRPEDWLQFAEQHRPAAFNLEFISQAYKIAGGRSSILAALLGPER